MNDDAIMIDAAKAKCALLLNPNRPADRINYEMFCRVFDKFRFSMARSEFWQRSESFRDSVFAHFCRNFVMAECANEEQQRTAARLFQQVNEQYTHRTLQKINKEFEANMSRQGFRYVGTFGGIKQYKHVGPIGETPKKNPVKKRIAV